MPYSKEDYSRYVQWGTSTWTYEGWKDLVYHKQYRKSAFKKECLAEYARDGRFSTVGMDLFFYRPPSRSDLEFYAEQLPSGFKACSKVWDEITVKQFPYHPRYGARMGLDNPNFLNAELFESAVLEPYRSSFREFAGPFIFEFGYLSKEAMPSVRAFGEQLSGFFSRLPKDFKYSVEIRNRNFLAPAYFDALREHGVAHVFNWWSYMPPISYQRRYDSLTADFIVSRVLTPLAVKYSDAVKRFQPYNQIVERLPEMRHDVLDLVETAMGRKMLAYILINNRSEGSAPYTISEMNEMVRANLLG
ncbi:MAG: DUF72 domain-containing protein [Candidatus Latescibacterota bacterium]